MATDPTIMKLRLAQINGIIQKIPRTPKLKYLSDWERGEAVGESELANKVRQIVNNLPKGYHKIEPSLKSKAKVRFLQWRENQAKAEWKTLSEEEQAKWESYVAEGIEFGEIRARELEREAPFEVGDKVVLHHNLSYLGVMYPAGSAAKISRVVYDEVREEKSYMIWFDDQRLVNLNAYAHEIRKA